MNTPTEPEGSPAPTSRNARRLLWLIKLAVGVSIIIYFLYFFDSRDVWERISKVQPVAFAAAITLILLQLVVFAGRWRYVASCTGGTLPVKQAIIGNFELSFASLVVPTAIAGDAARVLRARRAGLSVSQSLVSVFVDRVLGLTCIVMLTPLIFVTMPETKETDHISFLSAGLALLFVAGLMFLYFIGPLLSRFGHYPIVHFFRSISEAFRILVRDFRIAGLATAASLVGYSLAASALQWTAAAISIHISFLAALPVICVMSLATLIPISVGGWGVREGAAVIVFGLFHLSPEDALSVSVLYGIGGTLVGLLGGAVWLMAGRASVQSR